MIFLSEILWATVYLSSFVGFFLLFLAFAFPGFGPFGKIRENMDAEYGIGMLIACGMIMIFGTMIISWSQEIAQKRLIAETKHGQNP